VGVGLGLGIVGALVLTRVLTNLLYGVHLMDIPTFGGVVVVLGTVASMACAIPTWRAARIDPMEALRYE
jgi:ABC-type antimicrobial peptide transport system permease subunit